MENFGEKIRELRKERGITSYEIVTKLGISRNTLTNWNNRIHKLEKRSFENLYCNQYSLCFSEKLEGMGTIYRYEQTGKGVVLVRQRRQSRNVR